MGLRPGILLAGELTLAGVLSAGAAPASAPAASQTATQPQAAPAPPERLITWAVLPSIPPITLTPAWRAVKPPVLAPRELLSPPDRPALADTPLVIPPQLAVRPPVRLAAGDPIDAPPTLLGTTPDPFGATPAVAPLLGVTEALIVATTPAPRTRPVPFLRLTIPDPDDRANTPATATEPHLPLLIVPQLPRPKLP